jgi:phenylalanyl-tRNA synthetase beta chain
MAVRLAFQSEGGTLNDDQVEPAVRAIVERLASTLGARQRG